MSVTFHILVGVAKGLSYGATIGAVIMIWLLIQERIIPALNRVGSDSEEMEMDGEE